jgi:AcrR family transcriptional regulator
MQNTTRIQRKKENTRELITSTALRLFKEFGIDATTMEQIAESADIAKGTLYNYYPVKEAIISDYLIRQSFEKNQARIQRLATLPDTRTRMVVSLQEMMEGVKAQSELFERYFVYRIQQMLSLKKDEHTEKGLHLLESEIIRLGQESRELRTDIPSAVLQGFFEFIFIEIAQQYYQNPVTFDADRLIPDCVDLFLSGTKVIHQ